MILSDIHIYTYLIFMVLVYICPHCSCLNLASCKQHAICKSCKFVSKLYWLQLTPTWDLITPGCARASRGLTDLALLHSEHLACCVFLHACTCTHLLQGSLYQETFHIHSSHTCIHINMNCLSPHWLEQFCCRSHLLIYRLETQHFGVLFLAWDFAM